MANLKGFDASQVEPTGTYEALPAGKYAAVIIESEMKPTKAGDGQYLQLKLQVTEGRYKNRTLFDRLNLKNKNETAVTIAKGTLSAICRAVGVMTPNDSSELHLKRLMIVVKVKDDQSGNPQNEIKGYEPYEAQSSVPIVDNNQVPW